MQMKSALESRMRPECKFDWNTLTIAEASACIHAGKLTPTDLTVEALNRIATHDGKLNAFISVSGEEALAQAKILDGEQKAGVFRSPLHGIPIGLKDNIDTAGTPTTAASSVFQDRIPTHDAEVARRLKAAGAVIVGKLNLHEFAAGGTGHVSAFGPARNPWAIDRVPGGSSSGSGAAVAGRLCLGALGTDTGGSIRIPSSWCGLTGLKPTYGLVSIDGIVPLMHSLDHCGPMTHTALDAAIMLNVLAGYDPNDAASVFTPAEDYVKAIEQPTTTLRLGIPDEFYADLDPEVQQPVEAAIQVLAELTSGTTCPAILPPCGNIMGFLAETYSFHESSFRERPELYQPDTRQFLLTTPPTPAADYIRARIELHKLRRTIDQAFHDFDLIVLPTERIFPFTVEESFEISAEAEATGGISPKHLAVIANTYPFNMYGIPALTMPCGFSSSGLPVGITIAGPRFSEGKLLALAAAYQKITAWHTTIPQAVLSESAS